MRIITFDGRIGRNAEVLVAKNGRKYLRMSVANNMFTNNEERTDWFEVTCYDEFIVDKRAKYLTKGTYVIITGSIVTEVKPNNGKMWINHYVNATAIDTPRINRNNQDSDYQSSSSEPEVSVYTANTATQRVYQENNVQEPTIKMPSPSPQAAAPTYPSMDSYEMDNGDDLPF